MNEIQKNYITARASLEAYQEMKADAEKEYIKEHGISNADGTIPKYIWLIEDIDVFNKANEEFKRIIEKMELQEKINSARLALQDAEEILFNFCLFLIPENEREILKKESARDVTVRHRILNLGLCLDTSTIPNA